MLLVDFINVGYGEAILLRETETPFAMLVDCGDGGSLRRTTCAGRGSGSWTCWC